MGMHRADSDTTRRLYDADDTCGFRYTRNQRKRKDARRLGRVMAQSFSFDPSYLPISAAGGKLSVTVTMVDHWGIKCLGGTRPVPAQSEVMIVALNYFGAGR